MSTAARRLLAHSPFNVDIEALSKTSHLQGLQLRGFSKTKFGRAEDETLDQSTSGPSLSSRSSSGETGMQSTMSTSSGSVTTPQASKGSHLGELATIFSRNQAQRANKPTDSFLDVTRLTSVGVASLIQEERSEDPHHFHVYATRHNTHITLTKPNRDPLISVSAGNIGFRKSSRKHYDTAFQLAGYVMGRIQEQGLHAQINKLEVTLRGFGAGREAVTKALLGNEGRLLRGKVVKVSDATRLKFGGTRSKKPRRLG